MKLIETITSSSFLTGFKHVTCARPDCNRWLTQRHLETRKVGVTFEDEWYCSYKCFAYVLERAFAKITARVRPSAKHSFRMPLGLTLVSRGQLSSDQLRAANEMQKESGDEIGEVLLGLGYVDEKQLTSVRAAQWGCPMHEIPAVIPPVGIRVPVSLMKRYGMVPFQYSDRLKKISVGFVNGIEYGALYALEQITGCKAQPYLIMASDYRRYMAALTSPDAIEEQVFDKPYSAADMRHIVCNFGAEMDAEEAAVARCGEQLWTRLKRGNVTYDLLFSVR